MRVEAKVRGLGGEEALKDPPERWAEAFPLLVQELDLGRYFKHLSNHTRDPLHEIPRRAFYVFPVAEIRAYTERVLSLEAPVDDDIFFDSRIAFTHTPETTQRVWLIEVNGRFAGLYFPELESFALTDWTHSSSLVHNAAIPLVKRLLDICGLEPLPETPSSEKEPKELVPVEVTVGCDPEFELVEIRRDGPQVVAAYHVIDEPGDNWGQLGVDGAGSQMEVRPRAHSDPAVVVRNIRSILEYFAEKYASYDASPVGDVYPVGGHIHVGVGKSWLPPRSLIKMLDVFVGLPLMDLNGPARRGNDYGYGSPSDVRPEPHGFEYRTPPAAAFAEPKMAEIALKLVRNLVARVLNAPKEQTIVYHVPPYRREYMELGGLTREEVKYFLQFRRQWRKKEKIYSLRAAWGLGGAVMGAPKLLFRDDWASVARREYRRRLMRDETFRKVAAGMTIVLYGLAESRGRVASIPIKGFDLLESPPHPLCPARDQVVIGLPWVARVEPTWQEHIDNVIPAIVNAVKNIEMLAGSDSDSSPDEEENTVRLEGTIHLGEWHINQAPIINWRETDLPGPQDEDPLEILRDLVDDRR